MTVIDADGWILGRLASMVAKRLLRSEEIIIVNAEKAVITGSKEDLIGKYMERRERGSKEKGPFYPKRADKILKRAIRGMLPYKKNRGRDALSRLKVYIGIPAELENKEMEKSTVVKRGSKLGEIIKNGKSD